MWVLLFRHVTRILASCAGMSVGIFPSRWGWGTCVAMSATIVFGFFTLSGGQRVQTTKPDGSSKTYHCLYDTAIQCPSGAIFPAQLRIYSPSNDTPLADDTIAFVLARAYIPPSIPKDAILLEASNVVAVPGDPSSEEYESRVPDSPWPYVFGLGTVSSRAVTLPDGVSKAFLVGHLIMFGMPI